MTGLRTDHRPCPGWSKLAISELAETRAHGTPIYLTATNSARAEVCVQ